MADREFEELAGRLRTSGARWTARDVPAAELEKITRSVANGVVVNAAELAAAMAPEAAATPVAAYATEIDWRNHNGNQVTAIRDQGLCGSCVSFACCATVESMSLIERRLPVDLSEAELHFCSSHGANCGGWWPDDALREIAGNGVAGESQFGYSAAFDQPPKLDPATGVWVAHCQAVSAHAAYAVKIGSWGTVADVTARKNHLTNVGPVLGVFRVYSDFRNYAGGVYHHLSGPQIGLHAVEVIGYSDTGGYWICKNSWGPQFGEQGFFRIAYGECGLDTEFPFWTVTGVRLPQGEVGPFAMSGRLTLLRVHELGTGYGAGEDFLDAEAIVKLDSSRTMSFGLGLRSGTALPARRGMLQLLADAYEAQAPVTIEYMIRPYRLNGRVVRVVRSH